MKSAKVIPAFRTAPAMEAEDESPIALPPGTQAAAALTPSVSEIDLSGQPKAILLIGAGRTGKTTLARWMAETAIAADRAPILAAADPLNRSLAKYFDGVAQPATAEPAATAAWLEKLLSHLMAEPTSAIMDLGGGDTSLTAVLRGVPDLAETMEAAGIPVVALYLCGSRIDDLAAVANMEAAGFKPKARAIVLNESLGEQALTREEAFAAVLRHSAYRKAVDGGCVPLWMPRIHGGAAAEVENKRISFAMARDGQQPEGRTVAPLGPFNRSRIRTWLNTMEREFAPVRNWMP